ncbi:MAG: phosphatidylserine decarboxylase family protein [Bacteroidetes bacterium]|nr:MAG: phosphatidylserine decarboxylase family protein [Bacteroidota bacterium]
MNYIHKEGRTLLLTLLISFLAILVICKYVFGEGNYLLYLSLFFAMIFLTFFQFFRNPSVEIPVNPKHVIAPADGKVVVIEKTQENEYLKDERIQVSIFMSPINVHVNRNPIAGVVSYFKYHPGKFLVAWHPKASTENERTTVVVKHNSGVEVLFRQIAGALAKRIKWYVKEGDAVAQGEEFGFIKFGSRVDIFLPTTSKVLVNLNQVTKGGETIIAEL